MNVVLTIAILPLSVGVVVWSERTPELSHGLRVWDTRTVGHTVVDKRQSTWLTVHSPLRRCKTFTSITDISIPVVFNFLIIVEIRKYSSVL